MKINLLSGLLLSGIILVSCSTSEPVNELPPPPDNTETPDSPGETETPDEPGKEPEKDPTGPIITRVNIQTELATADKIVGGEWVAIGSKKEHALQYDPAVLYNGHPSYRFELKGPEDNTIGGYQDAEKGRTELSYCYATPHDFADKTKETLNIAQKLKYVYHFGKGIIPQGATSKHVFSFYMPEDIDSETKCIFAQIHGMPDRTLVKDPSGRTYKMSEDEYLDLIERSIFEDNIGYEKVFVRNDKNGKPVYEKGQKNGYLIDGGGFPPLSCGVHGGWVYIKCMSDRKWITDLTERDHQINPVKNEIMQEQTSDKGYKKHLLAWKTPLKDFPKGRWVTFDFKIKWSKFSGETEIEEPGSLNVVMSYTDDAGQMVTKQIVEPTRPVHIGHNNEEGHYFKFGIYRPDSEIPVHWNLAGYSQTVSK